MPSPEDAVNAKTRRVSSLVVAFVGIVATIWFFGGFDALQQCIDQHLYPPTAQPSSHDLSTNRVLLQQGAACIIHFVQNHSGFFLVLLTGVLALYTYRLWRDANNNAATQAKRMQASVDAATQSAIATQGSVELARESLEVAERGIDLQRTEMEQGLRAYVGLSPKGMKPVIEGKAEEIHCSFDLTNFGQTPAFGMTMAGELHVGGLDYNPTALSPGESRGVFWPGEFATSSAALVAPVTQEDEAAISEGTKRVYLVVTIRYQDVFGNDRTTRACRFFFKYGPDGSEKPFVGVHANGNDAT